MIDGGKRLERRHVAGTGQMMSGSILGFAMDFRLGHGQPLRLRLLAGQ